MKILKILIFILSIFILLKFFSNYHFEKQIESIKNNPTNSRNCFSFSTNKFRSSEDIKKEYIYYICRLNPDIKSLAFFYDKEKKEIVNIKVLSYDFDTLQVASPKVCEQDYNKENSLIYQRCSVWMSKNGTTGEFWFSTPNIILDKN